MGCKPEFTAVVHAAALASVDIMRVLIKYGATYNLAHWGGTCQFSSFCFLFFGVFIVIAAIYKHAITNGRKDLLKELIDMGMPVICERGVTPMGIITNALRIDVNNYFNSHYLSAPLANVCIIITLLFFIYWLCHGVMLLTSLFRVWIYFCLEGQKCHNY